MAAAAGRAGHSASLMPGPAKNGNKLYRIYRKIKKVIEPSQYEQKNFPPTRPLAAVAASEFAAFNAVRGVF